MIFRSDKVVAQWDTWCFHHEGTYYLYYLITESSHGEGFGVATSADAVHWEDRGQAIRESRGNSHYLGTGAVWKAPDFETSGRFICNYSEHRKDESGGNTQNILFAHSTDLVRWTKYGDERMFAVDGRYYDRFGRWDCIFPMPRRDGGYWGIWTATARPESEHTGIVGIGFSDDGLTWQALPPPLVEPGVGEAGAFHRFGERIHAMFGAGGGMWAYVADRVAPGSSPQATRRGEVTGPYRRAARNALLLAPRHTYFSRFFPTPGGVLVNHHSMSGAKANGRPVTYAAPLKLAVVDDEGVLRFKYWEGNEALKGEPVEVATLDAASPPSRTRTVTEALDFVRGVVVEGTVDLARCGPDAPSGVFIEADGAQYAVRFLGNGSVEMGAVDPSCAWTREHGADRERRFPRAAPFRLLLRRGMLEAYLDDHFMECWMMGCPEAREVKVGVLDDASGPAVADLRAWQMSLPGGG